jgi:hypothetical protein
MPITRGCLRGRSFVSCLHLTMYSGRSAARLARLPWAQEVVGSNPAAPTTPSLLHFLALYIRSFLNSSRKGVRHESIVSPSHTHSNYLHFFSKKYIRPTRRLVCPNERHDKPPSCGFICGYQQWNCCWTGWDNSLDDQRRNTVGSTGKHKLDLPLWGVHE